MKQAAIACVLSLVGSIADAQAPAQQVDVSFVNEAVVDAPIQDVWRMWSTSDGYRALGVALADVDLRIGGLIRSRYSANGALGDEQTIENEILAFEPPRMIAIRIHRPPANFPFKQAWKRTWTVVTLTELDGARTQVRAASLGYGNDEESLAMRRFFERGNDQTLKMLMSHFARGPAR
jgi:uncharacterized protein YndB with AHSA1/START domain